MIREEQAPRRLRQNLAVRRRDFLAALDDFSGALAAEPLRSTLGAGRVAQLRRQEQGIRERLVGRFSLVVLGEFKRGKSMLVNALLGRETVTSDVTPETLTVNEITYGPEPRLSACLEDGRLAPLSPGELRAARLEKVLEGLPARVERLEIETPVEWLKGMRLVDTPGLGDLFLRFDRQVQDYLPQADAVLYVVSALSPLAETERLFLRLALRPQDLRKVFFVVNQLDALPSETDARRVLESVRGKLGRLFPEAPVFGVSALDELNRVLGLPRPQPAWAAFLAESFATFRAELEESILLHRELLQLDRCLGRAAGLVGAFDLHAERLREALTADGDRLARGIAQCEDQESELHLRIAQEQQAARARVEELRLQAAGWMDGFLDRLATAASAGTARASLEELQRHFSFYVADCLNAALGRILEAHQPVVAEIAGQARSAMDAEVQRLTESPGAGEALGQAASRATFQSSAWTELDTFDLLFDRASLGGAGAALRLLSADRAGASRLRQAEKFRERLRDSFPELRATAEAEIGSLYGRLAAELEEKIGTAYRQELEEVSAALRAARDLQEGGQGRGAAAHEALEAARELAAQTRGRLDGLRQALWPGDEETVEMPVAIPA